ncbi:MAG: hypothetical protein ACO1Q7_00660 [Gemmatimonas sp.]
MSLITRIRSRLVRNVFPNTADASDRTNSDENAATAQDAASAKRRGFALLTVLLIAVVGSVIALASGMMAMSNVLVQGSSDRAAMVDDAALSGLEIERSRLNARLDTVPLNGFATVENGVLLPNTGGVRRTTWISRLGNSDSLVTTGEFGVQAEVVSRAIDPAGNVAIRRVEMYQESFARYASFTDMARSTNGTALYWALGAQAQGPVHSNDTIWVWNGNPKPQAIFHDKVTTARIVLNKTSAEFRKGQPAEQIARIALPTNADLDILKNIASRAGYVFTPDVVTGDSALVTMRIEFVALDLDGDGTTTGPDEGFFRVYKMRASVTPPIYGWGYAMGRPSVPPLTGCVISGATQLTCVDPIPAIGAVPLDSVLYSWNCGVPQMVGGLVGMPTTFAQIATRMVNGASNYQSKMQDKQAAFDNAAARCYLGGDERLSPTGVFRPTDAVGYWVPRTSGTVPPAVAARADGAYLWPLSAAYNSSFRGVIFAEGKVGVSGTVRGRVTLASRANMVILHDLRQATSPAIATGTCDADDDILGLFSGQYVMYADNTLSTPQRRLTGGTGNAWGTRKEFDPSTGRPDLSVHASILALRSVSAENSNAPAGGQPYVTRGTIRLIGGTIESRIGQTGTMSGSNLHGYYDDLSFNRCSLKYPPPYFPTTGRWTRTQFFEVNPSGFTPANWFAGR